MRLPLFIPNRGIDIEPSRVSNAEDESSELELSIEKNWLSGWYCIMSFSDVAPLLCSYFQLSDICL